MAFAGECSVQVELQMLGTSAYAGACACAVSVFSLCVEICFVRWVRFSRVEVDYGRVAAIPPGLLTRLLSSHRRVGTQCQVFS